VRSLLRWLFALVAALALCMHFPSVSDAGFVQLQRAQTAVYVLVNVAPNPLAVRPDPRAIAYDGPHFDVAQTTKQHGVPVQANVIANATGTLLTTDTNNITINQMAGTSAIYPCSYHVRVKTAVTSWSLTTGLSNDFDTNFNGNTMAWSDYLTPTAPVPSPTPKNFIVYGDNNNAWQADRRGSVNFDECVDLTLSIPTPVPGGSYSTNAVYSLYY